MRATRARPPTGCRPSWVAERLDAGDAPTLAATAAGAARWLAGFVRVLGWPLPGPGPAHAARRAAATAPCSTRGGRGKRAPVAVRSGADARLGRVTGVGRLRAGGPPADGRRRRQPAGPGGVRGGGRRPGHRRRPGRGRGHRRRHRRAGPGRRRRRPARAPARRWSRTSSASGSLAAGRAVRPPAPPRRRPAGTASWPPTAPPGLAWLAGPGRWRGGLPVCSSHEPAADRRSTGRPVSRRWERLGRAGGQVDGHRLVVDPGLQLEVAVQPGRPSRRRRRPGRRPPSPPGRGGGCRTGTRGPRRPSPRRSRTGWRRSTLGRPPSPARRRPRSLSRSSSAANAAAAASRQLTQLERPRPRPAVRAGRAARRPPARTPPARRT